MAEFPSNDRRREADVAPLPPTGWNDGAGTHDERDRGNADAAPLPPRVERDAKRDDLATGAFDKYLAIQRPIVLAQIRQLRRRNPNATPAELLRKIELQYLNSVTATGGGAGVAAVVPGVGTAASLAISGAETIGFLEMTALYAQAVAEIHGVAVADPVRARTLVQTLLAGEAATDLVRQFAGQVTGKGGSRQDFWGEMVTRSLPRAMVSELSARIRDTYVKRFAASTAGRTVSRLVPFGIGAVIGGAGNRILAKKVVRMAAEAFGPPPNSFSLDLHPDPVVRGDKAPRAIERGGKFLFFRLPRKATMPAIEAGEVRDD